MNFTYTFCFMVMKKLFIIFSFTLYILLSFLVKLWQQTRFIRSLFFFSECRFFPSCSDYFLEAIKKKGLILGLMLSVKRLFRCHPLCEGGIDEVPPQQITRLGFVSPEAQNKPDQMKGAVDRSHSLSVAL